MVEETHGNADPEILRHLEADMLFSGLVDDEVAIIHGLHAKIVKVEVGGRIKG